MAESTKHTDLKVSGNVGVEEQQSEASISVDIEEQQRERFGCVEFEELQNDTTKTMDIEDQQTATHVNIEGNQNGPAESGSDALEYICQPCSTDDKKVQAVGFCVDCSELLCTDCFNYHPKLSMSKNHKLVDIEQAKREENFTGRHDLCNKMCTDHRGKIIEYFCIDHKCLACGVCINLNHKNCPNVQYIPMVSNSTATDEEYSEIMRELDDVIQKTNEVVKTSNGNLNKTQANYTKALSDVKQVTQNVIETLEKSQIEIESEAETIKSDNIEKMKTNVASCDDILTEAEYIESSLKKLRGSGQKCNLFVAMKTEKENIKSIKRRLNQTSGNNCISDYLFVPNNNVQELSKKSGMLGQLLQQSDEVVTKVDEICVKTDTDTKTCAIYGAVLLASSKMVIGDSTNKTVKLLDLKQCEVKYELLVANYPQEIANTDEKDEIAVALGWSKKICLFKVKDDLLHRGDEIKVAGKCYGLDFTNGNFVAGLVDPAILAIIDRKGNVLKTIQTDKNGKYLFECPRSVVINSETETVYVADSGKNTVTALSASFEVKTVYEEKCMAGARGLTIDKRGKVYVCWADSKVICQMTPDLSKSCLMMSPLNGLAKQLRSMKYCAETDKFYIGLFDDKLQVYKLDM